MHDWLYKFVDLPAVPQNIIDDCMLSIKNWDQDEKFWWWPKSAEEIDYINGQPKKSIGFIQFNIPEHATNWFIDNIVESGYNNIKIASNTSGDHKGAHSDKTRDYVLMYLLTSGGEPQPQTVWYKEKDMPTIRERKSRCHDYSLLEEIGRVTIPLHSWIILNSRILHGIDQILSLIHI